MALTRYVTEMGMGADVHGQDYTKAAKRAVSDAIRHSSLNFFRALNKSPDDMRITVRIGVAEPDQVDTTAVAAELPYGVVSVECVMGGLNVPGPDDRTKGNATDDSMDKTRDAIVIANAAVLVCFEE